MRQPKTRRSDHGFLDLECVPGSTQRIDRPGVHFYEMKDVLNSIHSLSFTLLYMMEDEPSGEPYWTNERVGLSLYRLQRKAAHALMLDGYLEHSVPH